MSGICGIPGIPREVDLVKDPRQVAVPDPLLNLGFRLLGFWVFEVRFSGFRVSGFGFSGFRVLGFWGFGVSVLGFRVLGF